ncbi:MAG: hypothetical protein U0132_01005 [Gemmatimonadaceae bacterium]
MTIVQELVNWAGPWQSMYNDSKVVSTTVTTVHLVALMFGGGLAVAADRSTLRAGRAASQAAGFGRPQQLAELHAVHRPVLIALGILFVSGLLLAAADVETYATSWAFWVKMGLVALLVVNGALLTRTETSLRGSQSGEPKADTLWARLRTGALISIGLWTATLIAGAILVNA